ncbi:hypothetical protein EDD15DRAFT_2366291 [Pisolithus albus]|nr:hypothetical protein EDD15DRAFT_2366291 [Pisolithus albus]
MFNIPLVVTTSNKPLQILSDSQAFLRAPPRGLLPPRNRSSSPLPPSSPPEALPQSPQLKPSSSSSTDELPQQPVWGDVQSVSHHFVPLHHAPDIIHANITGIINSVRAIMICPHHREGTITVSSDMSIKIFHVSDAMAMFQMMTIIAVTIMWATKTGDSPSYSGDSPPHYGESPCHSGDSPPHSGDSPSHYGELPPQSGDSPSHYGELPCHSGELPPHSGELPPHSGDSPPHSVGDSPHQL